MFCIRLLIGSDYIIFTVVLIMSFFTQHNFFVTAANVVTEAFARLVSISGGFHSGSDLGTVSAAGAG
jgi:hypothetical protein